MVKDSHTNSKEKIEPSANSIEMIGYPSEGEKREKSAHVQK